MSAAEAAEFKKTLKHFDRNGDGKIAYPGNTHVCQVLMIMYIMQMSIIYYTDSVNEYCVQYI